MTPPDNGRGLGRNATRPGCPDAVAIIAASSSDDAAQAHVAEDRPSPDDRACKQPSTTHLIGSRRSSTPGAHQLNAHRLASDPDSRGLRGDWRRTTYVRDHGELA